MGGPALTMSKYNYMLPVITMAPPPGYTLAQQLPLPALRSQLDVEDASIEVTRTVVESGAVRSQDQRRLILERGIWVNPEDAFFSVNSSNSADWMTGDSVAYLETSIVAEDGALFSSRMVPANYTAYSGEHCKTFLSDNRVKYSDNVVISQINKHGVWADGHPYCEVNPAADLDVSFVILNPFTQLAVATFEFEGVEKRLRRRIGPLSGQRIDFAQCLSEDDLPWSGQVYVSGRNRLVAFLVFHSYSNPSIISTLEHTDAYRGETQYKPFTHALYHRKEWSKRGLPLKRAG